MDLFPRSDIFMFFAQWVSHPCVLKALIYKGFSHTHPFTLVINTTVSTRDELKKRIADMSTFLKKQPTALTEYDEQLIRRLIEKVTIYEDKFTVEFKSGLTVDVEE